jgi:hypothetical protein
VFDASFWAGALIGVGASALAWFIPAKVLVPEIEFGDLRRTKVNGQYRYTITIENIGRRDIIDVTVSCTLFSRGWGDGNESITATVNIPTPVGHIDVMPGTASGRTTPELADLMTSRIITLQPHLITSVQLDKLNYRTDNMRERITNGSATLEEILGLGKKSFINVAVYGADRYSGTRGLYNGLVIKHSKEAGWKSVQTNRRRRRRWRAG